MYWKLTEIFLFLTVSDYSCIYLSKRINKNLIVIDYNTRWFFIHSLGNIVISAYALPDLKTCIKDPLNCHSYGWSDNSYTVFYITILMHLYHSVFFKLSRDDLIHHISMCGIAAPLSFYYKTKVAVSGTFFMSGFPGCIDYFLLYLVKIGKLSRDLEKIIYVYLTTWIRAPGICFVSFMAVYGLPEVYKKNISNNNHNYYNLLACIISTLLTFWNGQYYMMKTCIDYGNKLAQQKDIMKSIK
jgi:hypothetical protein